MSTEQRGDIGFREIERADLVFINRWRNDPEIVAGLGAPFRHIATEVDEAWYDRYLAARESQVRLMVLLRGEPVGMVNLTDIQPIHRCAEFSIQLGDASAHGLGLGTVATEHIVRHGFDDLNLHRIELFVLTTNERAISLYERTGFVHEGVMRDAVFKGGRFHDLATMAQLNGERNV